MNIPTFTAKFGKMRKAQSFVVYPGNVCEDPTKFKVQSDTYIGIIDTERKQIVLAGPYTGGAYFRHLHMGGPKRKVHDVTDELIEEMRAAHPQSGDKFGAITIA